MTKRIVNTSPGWDSPSKSGGAIFIALKSHIIGNDVHLVANDALDDII